MEKLAKSLDFDHEKTYKPISTNRFDDISNCESTPPHKIVWGIKKVVRALYKILRIEKSCFLNFLDTMIFSDGFYVIEVVMVVLEVVLSNQSSNLVDSSKVRKK